MPDYAVPLMPEGLDPKGFILTVRVELELAADEYERIRKDLGSEEKHLHARFASEVKLLDGEAGKLTGLIGLHDLRETREREEEKEEHKHEKEEPYPDAWLVYELVLKWPCEARQALDDRWTALYSAIVKAFPEKPVWRIFLSLFLPASKVLPFVNVPIPLAESEISGFSEIRGVRVVQPDPEDAENELYSVILDHRGELMAIRVEAPLEAGCDESILSVAFERALSIAKLAFETVREQ